MTGTQSCLFICVGGVDAHSYSHISLLPAALNATGPIAGFSDVKTTFVVNQRPDFLGQTVYMGDRTPTTQLCPPSSEWGEEENFLKGVLRLSDTANRQSGLAEYDFHARMMNVASPTQPKTPIATRLHDAVEQSGGGDGWPDNVVVVAAISGRTGFDSSNSSFDASIADCLSAMPSLKQRYPQKNIAYAISLTDVEDIWMYEVDRWKSRNALPAAAVDIDLLIDPETISSVVSECFSRMAFTSSALEALLDEDVDVPISLHMPGGFDLAGQLNWDIRSQSFLWPIVLDNHAGEPAYPGLVPHGLRELVLSSLLGRHCPASQVLSSSIVPARWAQAV